MKWNAMEQGKKAVRRDQIEWFQAILKLNQDKKLVNKIRLHADLHIHKKVYGILFSTNNDVA
jgi:hypothetical protein